MRSLKRIRRCSSTWPLINVGSAKTPINVQLTYDPSPWLIADGALLLLGIIPGVIALGVDFFTGSWRILHDPQVLHTPNIVE